MLDTTKRLKAEMQRDIRDLRHHFNRQDGRSPEQVKQSRKDKANYYITKWLKKDVETSAQREYVLRVVDIAIDLGGTVIG